MHPYRPLFVTDDTDEPPPTELRGLAIVLVALGMLRIVPALVRDEAAGTEILLAATMLALGTGILVRVGALAHWFRVYLYRRR